MSIKKAIIPAAGLGTRFLPATKSQPKEMLPIVDKPTIQYIVEEAVSAGIEEILIITGRNKRAIEDHFDKSYELEMELAKKNNIEMLNLVKEISNLADIYYIRQKETKGLGHAIYCAKHFVGNEAFAVMLGDDIIYSQKPVIKQLIECYEEYKTSIVGVQEVPLNKVNKYGIINGVHIENNVYKVKDLVEKPDEKDTPSNIAILGRYIITPQIFDVLVHTKPGKNGEIQLTDALKSIILREAVHAYKFEGKRYDVGDKLEFLAANIEFALKNMELTSAFEDYLLSLASKLQHKKTM